VLKKALNNHFFSCFMSTYYLGLARPEQLKNSLNPLKIKEFISA